MLRLSRGIQVTLGDVHYAHPRFDLIFYDVDRLDISRWLIARALSRRGIDPTGFSWICGSAIIPLPAGTPDERSPMHATPP